jgi:Methyltransferase FkbM domain
VEEVRVARLDQTLASNDGERIYLKIDVQGYELRVLAGADRTLARVVAVEMELALAGLYNDQPLLRDQIDVLGGLGFEIFSLEPTFFDQEGRLLEMDGVFVRVTK